MCYFYVVDKMNLDTVIEGCKEGNRAMQKRLYEEYSPRYYALCRRYSADDEEAREILTEGFISVFEDIKMYRYEGSFEGWMQTIFMRKAVKMFRDKKRRQRYFEAIDDIDYEDERVDIVEQIDVRDALVAALQRLPKDERVVFNLVAVEEFTLPEAAEELEISVSTVKTRYYKALQTVQTILKRRLGKEFLKKYKLGEY